MNYHSIIDECYHLSIAGLKANSSTSGLLAARNLDAEGKKKNYDALYSRDIGVSALGILATQDEDLLAILKTSLTNLAKAQSLRGQLPFYVKPEEGEVQFWTPGSIDSSLWWAIAFLLYIQETNDQQFYEEHRQQLEKAFTWLTYQDTNNDTLLEQGEESDWADRMPRHGTVLYTNALWYWLICLRIEIEHKNELLPLRSAVYEAFNTVFWIHKQKSSNISYMPDNTYIKRNVFAREMLEYTNSSLTYLPYYLGSISNRTFEARCDVFGNILACLTGLADTERAELITDFIYRSGINLPHPIKVLYPPIYPGEDDWRPYMIKGRENYPWQYHNGGIWPFVGGFWVTWLAQQNRKRAEEELERLALANQTNNWEFNEYLHGQHGTPMGVPYQTWNMAMFLKAYHTLYKMPIKPV